MNKSSSPGAMPFERALDKLPDDVKKAVDQWFVDAQPLKGGADVTENTKSEKQLEEEGFVDFLAGLGSYYQQGLLGDSKMARPESAYEKACSEPSLHYNGPKSMVSVDTVLHHVLNKEILKEIIYEVMEVARVDDDDFPDSKEEAWTHFWESGLTDEERMEILTDVGLFYDKYLVWAYFDSSNAELGTDLDPLAGRNADDHCRIVGLPSEWTRYDYGQHLYKIRYKWHDAKMRHVPTIVDASASGWNPYFQPAKEDRANAKWGWTRPLGTPRGTTGVPEVVHKGSESSSDTASFVALPEDLGMR